RKPAFRRRRHRQSIRLSRNGFSLHGERLYVAKVVERETAPLPACAREVGIDLGLANLAVTSDGEVIGHPRFLRAAGRRLARAHKTATST
ncbi:MAG TPA: hypothetical protein VGD91_20935, partial [Trebonia sp.]